MLPVERERLVELTSKAISINQELLDEEHKFLAAAAAAPSDPQTLKEMNDKISDLVLKEHLHVAAARSLLEIILK